MVFTVPVGQRVKLKESEKKDKYLYLCKGTEEALEHENDSDAYCSWCTRYGHKRIGNKSTSGDHLKYSTVKIGQNTETSPGDLRRLVVT